MLGTRTNIPFLIRLLELPAFRDGRLHTGMIDEHLAELTRQDDVTAGGARRRGVRDRAGQLRTELGDTDGNLTATRGRRCTAGDDSDMPSRTITLEPADAADDDRQYRVEVDGTGDELRGTRRGAPLPGRGPTVTARCESHPRGHGRASRRGPSPPATSAGSSSTGGCSSWPRRVRSRAPAAGHHGALTAPMPATVRRVLVGVGDAVKRGDSLVILEAMKMELPVRADVAGIVTAVHCREGELVQPGLTLIEIGE